MNIGILKSIVGVVVSIGVGSIVKNIITATSKNTNIYSKICISVGGIVLGAMIADKAVAHSDNMIDGIVEDVNRVRKDIKKEITKANEELEDARSSLKKSKERVMKADLALRKSNLMIVKGET